MKIPSILLFLILFYSFATYAQGAEKQHVANIKNTTGTVSVLRSETSLIAKPGMQLFAADAITSSKNSSAGILFTDGTSLALGPSTEINIEDYLFQPDNEKYNFSMYMKKGSALYSTGKLGKLSPESVKLHTPMATVGVRGTRFIVKVD